MNTFNIAQLKSLKQAGEKITSVTVYDASFAQHVEEAGIEVMLVGDTLGMVVQGNTTTIPVSVDHMVYHSQIVARGSQGHALRVVDMPFMSYTDMDKALKNAQRIMQEGQAHVVKLEGAGPIIDLVAQFSQFGVPVCAHLGLLPQSINKLGKYKIQGRELHQAQQIINDANAMQEAGAEMLILECVPQDLAKTISQNLQIPVIGIGAGPYCDGQVLVLYDLLGITPGHIPKFSKNYLKKTGSVQEALKLYVSEVKSGDFPGPDHSYK